MKIAVYGGSFNPPHLGHLYAVKAALRQLKPDKFLVIPDREPPHKALADGSPSPETRLELCRKTFASLPEVTVSDMELRRPGKSYTWETLQELKARWPGSDFYLLMGTDMLESFEKWYRFYQIGQSAVLTVFPREKSEKQQIEAAAERLKKKYGFRVETVSSKAYPAASSQIREKLQNRQGRNLLQKDVYASIITDRLYGAKPDWKWLREQAYDMLQPKRIPHVRGCEEEARRLAKRWGANVEDAAEAAILHDITKKLDLREQLLLCEKYDIIMDTQEKESAKLLHAITGAAVARAEFGVSDAVYGAIRWHTTGKPDMSLLEKVIYMADYIEPTRTFDGVNTLRRLAYQDLDKSLVLGFSMSLQDVESGGSTPHPNTAAAFRWYKERTGF